MSAALEDEIGDILGKARAGQGYSVEDASRVAGLRPSDIVDFESYRRAPSKQEVRALARALGLDPPKLVEIAGDAWLPEPDPWRVEPNVVVRLIPTAFGGYLQNCYVVGCTQTRRAVIVDPGGSVDEIAGVVSELALTAEAIAITHGHSDHTAGARSLARRIGISEVIGSPEDLSAVEAPGLSARAVGDGEEFRIGALTVKTLRTPGHTRGSLCYLCGLVCLVGDTLFAGSVGRAMSGPNSYRTLLESVRSKLLSLPKETAILPGHGPATSVGEELTHNPFF